MPERHKNTRKIPHQDFRVNHHIASTQFQHESPFPLSTLKRKMDSTRAVKKLLTNRMEITPENLGRIELALLRNGTDIRIGHNSQVSKIAIVRDLNSIAEKYYEIALSIRR